MSDDTLRKLEALLRDLKAQLDRIEAMMQQIKDATAGNPRRGLGH